MQREGWAVVLSHTDIYHRLGHTLVRFASEAVTLEWDQRARRDSIATEVGDSKETPGAGVDLTLFRGCAYWDL